MRYDRQETEGIFACVFTTNRFVTEEYLQSESTEMK